MKQIKIIDTFLYYTEVQIEKVNFWFISNDPFITFSSKYSLYICKGYTLAGAIEEFYKDYIEPEEPEEPLRRYRNYKYSSNFTEALTMVGSGVLSRIMLEKAEELKKKLEAEKNNGSDNINAI
jgi:hypothetical protein